MSCPVVIKGNQNGLRLIVDEEAKVSEIENTIIKGLKNVKKYALKSDKCIKLTFEGKALALKDIERIRYVFKQYGINTYLENTKDNYYKRKFLPGDEGLFLIGDIKKGQIVESKCGVVIVGNVEYGAKVISQSNVVIIGKVDGQIDVGAGGNTKAFAYSMISGRNNK